MKNQASNPCARRGERGQMVPTGGDLRAADHGDHGTRSGSQRHHRVQAQPPERHDAAALAERRASARVACARGRGGGTQAALTGGTQLPAVAVRRWQLVTPLLNQGCPSGGGQCSVTGVRPHDHRHALYDQRVDQGAQDPFVLTVNSPPLTAKVASYNGDPTASKTSCTNDPGHSSPASWGSLRTTEARSRSRSDYSRPGNPFRLPSTPRTISSRVTTAKPSTATSTPTVICRPQSHGHAGICAAPDSNGIRGSSFLATRSRTTARLPTRMTAVGDATEGGSHHRRGDLSVRGRSSSGSALDARNLRVRVGYPGNQSGGALTYASPDGACESNPPIQPPSVAALPNLISYPTTVCRTQGVSAGVYRPGESLATAGRRLPSTLPTRLPRARSYEIDPGAHTAGVM